MANVHQVVQEKKIMNETTNTSNQPQDTTNKRILKGREKVQMVVQEYVSSKAKTLK